MTYFRHIEQQAELAADKIINPDKYQKADTKKGDDTKPERRIGRGKKIASSMLASIALLSACGEDVPFTPDVAEKVVFYSGDGQIHTAEEKAHQIAADYKGLGIEINADELESEIHDVLKDESGFIHGGDSLYIGLDAETDTFKIYSTLEDVPADVEVWDISKDWKPQE